MLTTQRNVSVSTHNQALSALLFLYRDVLGVHLLWLDDVKRSTRPRHIPSVLPSVEVAALFGAMTNVELLFAKLRYAITRAVYGLKKFESNLTVHEPARL